MKFALHFFNDAATNNNPVTAADAGNGFLFRRGYTVVCCGWIGELLPGNNRMLLRAPRDQGLALAAALRRSVAVISARQPTLLIA